LENQQIPNGNDQALPAGLRKRVFSAPTIISIAIALASIVFMATRFDLNWSETMANIRTMSLWPYFFAFVLHYAAFVLRAVRWRVLVENASRSEASVAKLPSVPRLFQIIMIGWFVNSVVWLRLGDAYRAYLFSAHATKGFSWSLGTILAERVLDLGAITVLIGIGALFVSAGSIPDPFVYVAAALTLMGLGVAFLIFMKRFGKRLANVLPGRLAQAYHRLETGALNSLRRIPLLVTISIAVWLLETGRLVLVVSSLDLSLAYSVILIVTTAHALLASVPTPGGLGAVEVGVAGLLVLAGMARNDAGAVVIAERSITLVSVIGVGGILFLLRQMMHLQLPNKNRQRAGGFDKTLGNEDA
jgi:uncharacterized protein (TIRG00374 family)